MSLPNLGNNDQATRSTKKKKASFEGLIRREEREGGRADVVVHPCRGLFINPLADMPRCEIS